MDEYDNDRINAGIQEVIEDVVGRERRLLRDKLLAVLGGPLPTEYEAAFKEWCRLGLPNGMESIGFWVLNTVEYTVVESTNDRFVIEKKVVDRSYLLNSITRNNPFMNLMKGKDLACVGEEITEPILYKEPSDE